MNRVLRVGSFTLLIICSAAVASQVAAKGPPSKLVIEGPGLQSPIEVTEAETLRALGLFEILESDSLPVEAIEPPEGLGPGYILTRYYGTGDCDRVRYHADPAGGQGYIYDIGGRCGRIMGSSWDGQWFRVSARAEEVIQGLLAEHDVQLAGSDSGPTRSLSWASWILPLLYVVLALSVGGLAVAIGWRVRRLKSPHKGAPA